jgi:archaeal flagellar protein FlaJ
VGQLAKVLIPLAIIVMAATFYFFSLAYAMIGGALLILPVGVLALRDDWKLDAYDRDISTFIRAIGGVMSSAGITATDALSRLNRRSLGSLEPAVGRLYVRLQNGISPDLCWLRLAAETGSDLVVRCVRVFWDGVRVGGDTEKVSNLASEFALKVWLLRADRKLVATTFSFVAVPMHAVLMAILVFITEVVQIFGTQIAQVQGDSLQGGVAQEAGVSNALLFSFGSLDFVPVFVGLVGCMLTAANAFAPYAATGGHRLKICFYAAIMMLISGITFLVIPHVVQAVFDNISQTSTTPGAADFSGVGGA